MATVISKASIQMSVNSAAAEVGLKKTGASIKNFSATANRDMARIQSGTLKTGETMRGVGDQVGKVSAALSSFASLDLSRPQTIFAALQNTVAGVGSALETAGTKALVFRAALASTGIGLALAAIGGIISAFTRREESGVALPGRDTRDDVTRRLDDRRERLGIPTSIRPERAMMDGGSETAGSRGRRLAHAADEGAARRIEEAAAGARAFTAEMSLAARTVGLTTTETRLMGLEARALEARLEGAARGGRLSADAMRELDGELRTARISARAEEGAARVGGLATLRDSIRDTTATMGMSTAEAEVYRLTMVRTFETIGGVTVATTRAMTAAERSAAGLNGLLASIRSEARNRDLNNARAGLERFTESIQDATAGIGLSEEENTIRRYTEELQRMGATAEEIAWRVAAARRVIAGRDERAERHADIGRAATLRDADLSPIQRARAEIARITDLGRRGAIDESLRARSIGRILSSLTSQAQELRGPQMLEAGSVEAERLLREFRRGGERNLEEETFARLGEMRDEERRTREAMEGLGRRFAEIGIAADL